MTAFSNFDVATPTEREIVMTRTFDAPRDLVFDAMNEPDLLKRWLLGPDGWTMTVCDIDSRPGGRFRHVWNKDGTSMGMGGVYREVTRPERIVRTEIFDGMPEGSEAIATVALKEENKKTALTLTVLFPSKEGRDGALTACMDQGVRAGYDRLADLLGNLKAA